MRSSAIKLILLAVLVLLSAARAEVNFNPRTKIVARIIPERTQVAPQSTVNVLVEIQIAPGWHLQSYQPLEKFLKATQLEIKTDGPFAGGKVAYPDHKLVDAGSISEQPYLAVYEGTIYILAQATVNPDASAGPSTINAALKTQACDDKSCLPPSTTNLNAPIEIGTAGPISPDYAALTATPAVQALIQKLAAEPAKTATAPAATQAAAAPAAAESSPPTDVSELAVLASRDYRPADSGQALPIWQLILFALAGGAILNIMPCVLPVIPLKAVQLIQQAHGDRKQAIVHGLVFSAGVITLFAVLAVVLTTAFDGAVVYGKQFQNAGFIITMAMIVLALALSMLGVWTINPPQAVYQVEGPKSGYAGSFFMGLLATLLATPCSAPLLGSVLAWALVQPKMITVMMFILVGIGMSLPYILLMAFPSAIDRLPRAGRWADLLKQGLGIVMMGVALWLLLQLPPAVLPWALFGALVLGFVCWGWGQLPNPLGERSTLWTTRIIVVVVGFAAAAGLYQLSRPTTPGGAESGHHWQPLTLATLDAALKDGRPVVVDWTADWCWNCKVLDKTVLTADEVTKHFADKKAVLLKADMSHDNPLAEQMLVKLKGGAIPMLAVFSPKEPHRPVVLRDGYTRQRVIDEVTKATK